MKSRKIVNMALISILLSSVAIGAEHSNCDGGVCFITLSNSKSSKKIEKIEHHSDCKGSACFAILSKNEPSKVLEEKEQFKPIEFIEQESLNTNAISNIEKESKIVSIETYTVEEVNDMDSLLIVNPIEATDNKILEKTDLPSSDYFCDNDKQPVYLNDDTYECV